MTRARATATSGTTAPITAKATRTTRSATATRQFYGLGDVDSIPVRVVVQRANSAEVTVESRIVGRLPAPGLVILVGITGSDTEQDVERVANKVWGLRILDGELSASDVDAPLLVVSQFTLHASTRKGRRPSWSAAAPGPVSEPLVNHFVDHLRQLGAHVETGVFGAHMQVSLVNDGPMTILIDSEHWD